MMLILTMLIGREWGCRCCGEDEEQKKKAMMAVEIHQYESNIVVAT